MFNGQNEKKLILIVVCLQASLFSTVTPVNPQRGACRETLWPFHLIAIIILTV